MAGSTGLLACCACITAGGAELGATGALGGAFCTGIDPEFIDDPPQALSTAAAEARPRTMPNGLKGVRSFMNSPCSRQSLER
jgi:hypothetical protein